MSAWANWTPRHPAPWKVGVSFSQISPLDVTQQLQRFNSPVQQGVGLIIYEPLAPAPFAPAVDEAAKAGIASLDVVDTTPTADSVNQAINSWLQATTGGRRSGRCSSPS